MTRKAIRIMGQFEQAPRSFERSSSPKPKQCENCGKPVRDTVGNSGYCKKCIAEARIGIGIGTENEG